MIELVNVLMLLSIPIVYWRLRKHAMLWLKLSILLLLAANFLLNQATSTAMHQRVPEEMRKFFWLAFSCRLSILFLALFGIISSFRILPQKAISSPTTPQLESENTAGPSIPCPLCAKPLAVSTLKRGENYCSHCSGKFMAE